MKDTTATSCSVAVGWWHACVRTLAGNVHCWGRNTDGQAEDYTGGLAVVVSAGGWHTCILLVTGDVECYGDDDRGKSEDWRVLPVNV